jgi:hypothetical protein
LLALAERGVIIEAIIARSHTQDGIKLMRKLGLPWLGAFLGKRCREWHAIFEKI